MPTVILMEHECQQKEKLDPRTLGREGEGGGTLQLMICVRTTTNFSHKLQGLNLLYSASMHKEVHVSMV